MILFLSDLHCRFGVINQQILHAEEYSGVNIDAVIVLGDIGMFEPFLKAYFRTHGERYARPVYYIEGNHEDYDHLPTLIHRYRDVMTYLSRGAIQCIGSHRMLCLGGAQYMDAMTTPPGSEIRQSNIDACLQYAEGEVGIIISHDCPSGIGVASQPGFEHYGEPGFAGGERLVEHFRPSLWLFGHHHRWFDRTIGQTRFFGLPQSWCGYALLDEDGGLKAVEHEVEPDLVTDSILTDVAQRLRRLLKR